MKNLKFFLVAILLFALMTENVFGEGTETFEGLAKTTSYTNGLSWTGVNGLTWGASTFRTDQYISGSRGLTSKASTSCTITMPLTSTQQAAGMGVFTFKYKYPYSDSGKTNGLSFTINGHTYSGSVSYNSAVQTVNITVNESTLPSSITINIASGGRACFDDFSWTSCSAATLYTVTYNANGGSVTPTSATQASAGANVTLPTPSRAGYSFKGWYTAASGGTKVGDAGASYTPTADITIYAQWDEVAYYYRGGDNSWGATKMTDAGGVYAYVQSSNSTNQFKISRTADGWDYNYSYVSAGAFGTNVSNIGDYSSDNCYCWQSGTYYILVYYPNTAWNTSNNPIICACTYLPVSDSKWYVRGIDDDWHTGIACSGSGPYTADIVLPEETHEFKLFHLGNWYGFAGSTPITRATSSNWELPLNAANNAKITADVAGTYNFSIDASQANPRLTVTYPAKQYTITFNDRGATHDTKHGYVGDHITAPADPTGVCTVPLNYIFDGWSETPVTAANATSYTKVNFSTYTISDDATLYAVYKWADAGGGDGNYHLVESAPSDWSGDYLIAYSSSVFANGSASGTEGIGAGGNFVNPSTSLSGNVVDATWGDQYYVTLESCTGGYVLKTQDGSYNYQTTNKNGITASSNAGTADDYPLTIAFHSSSDIDIQCGSTCLHYNSSSPGYFRYYKDCGQSNIYLYKKAEGSTYYTTAPVCGAYISVTKNNEVYVTGGNAGGTRAKVQVQDTIFYTSGSLLPDGTGNHPRIYSNATDIVNISDGTQNTNFEVVYLEDSVRTKTDGKFAITGKIIVKYTPSANGVNENVRVSMHATYNTGASAPVASFDIHARALPDQFVIAAKTGGKWYALNGNMSGSQAQPANAQLIVDSDADPTVATYAPDVAIYTFDAMPNTGDLRNVRFVGSTNKYLWAAASGNTGIQNNASATPAGTGAEQYDWLLKSDDNVTYTLYNKGNTRDLGLHNTNIAFGMYANSSTYDIRILPIDAQCAYNSKPEQVTVSARTSTTATISVKTDATATKYQISNDNGANWTDASTSTSGDFTLISITGLTSNTSYTYSIRGAHGTGTICSDTAKIKFTTATCDMAPTISYATGGLTIVADCGTVMLEATGVAATSSCEITEYGFQLATNSTFTQNVQEIACSLAGTTLETEGTISKGGMYYARIYAINEVDTGFSANYASETLSGLPDLRIFTRDDATTAAMIKGKAELRVGAATNSPAAVTWTVKNPDGTDNATMAATLASKGMFSATSMGVYTVTATQAANADPVYCGQTVTTYIEVRKPHYYGHVTNCAALNNNDIEVLSISEHDITLELDDADMVQIEIVKENKGGEGTQKYADDLFISKYYESIGTSKLLAVFNGTDKAIDLSDVYLHQRGTDKFCLAQFGHTTRGKIQPGEELIFMGHGNSDVDECAEAEETYPNWYYNSGSNSNSVHIGSGFETVTGFSNVLNFGGKGTVWLERGGKVIDLLGATASRDASYPTIGSTSFKDGSTSHDTGDDQGYVCETGDDLYTEDVEENNYLLSTNRCFLVRKNTVVSGANAVANNDGDFVTLCEEWRGHQLSKKDADNGVQASCDGMAYVGSFNYAEYFNRYDPVTQKIDVTLDMTHNADGSWTLNTDAFAGTDWEGKNFHDLSCTNVQIKGYKDGNVSTTLNYKVPIIVDKTTTTTDATLFGFDGEGRVICPDCDVVIRDNKQLEVVTGGYNDVRDIFVYSGSALYVPTDRPYTARKLTIESENNAVGYTLISNGKLIAEDGIVHTKRIDAIAWYDFSLPYSCKVADIVRTNGKTIGEYGTDWVIMYYDGQKRANTGTPNGAAPTNWVSLDASATLEAGVGYIVGLGGSHETHPAYKVRFVLPNKAAQPYVEDGEGDSRDKAVKGYTGAAALRLPCHQGWNYIGSPYVSQFLGKDQDPGWKGSGLLLNGYYTDGLMGNTYDVETYTDLYLAIDEGSGGATDWVQYLASEATLPPFRAFFVQAVSDGNVNFQKAARALPAASAPMRRSENVEPVSEMRLVVSSDTYGSDKTTVKLHSSYTDAYDLGYDMARMLNNVKRPQPFTLNATDYLIYNAANRTTAETSDIPLGVKISATGEYTFAIDVLKAMDDYSAIYLIDKDENNLQFDLLQGNYTTRIASGMCTDRFGIRLVAKEKVTTDIDAQDGEQTANIYRDGESIIIENLPVDATVRVVDAVGRVLHMQKAEGQQLRFVSPIRGAYVIQVISENTNYSVKVVL